MRHSLANGIQRQDVITPISRAEFNQLSTTDPASAYMQVRQCLDGTCIQRLAADGILCTAPQCLSAYSVSNIIFQGTDKFIQTKPQVDLCSMNEKAEQRTELCGEAQVLTYLIIHR